LIWRNALRNRPDKITPRLILKATAGGRQWLSPGEQSS
jgi:hypothetical protein